MLAERILELSQDTVSTQDKIWYEIQYLATHGYTRWRGFIINNNTEIVNFFKSEGFKVIREPNIPILVTISWNKE